MERRDIIAWFKGLRKGKPEVKSDQVEQPSIRPGEFIETGLNGRVERSFYRGEEIVYKDSYSFWAFPYEGQNNSNKILVFDIERNTKTPSGEFKDQYFTFEGLATSDSPNPSVFGAQISDSSVGDIVTRRIAFPENPGKHFFPGKELVVEMKKGVDQAGNVTYEKLKWELVKV